MGKSSQENHQPKRLKAEDIVTMRKLGSAVISPDGKWIAFVQKTPILEHLSN